MTSPNSHPILKKLKNMWTQVRTFLTDSFQVLYLVAYLVTRLPLLLVKVVQGKLFSLSLLSRISLIVIPMGIVSLSDLTITLRKAVTINDLNDFFKRESMKNDSVTGYQEEQLVSIDFKGIWESVFVDGRWTCVLKDKTVKLVLWYDNEWGYSNRVCDMANLMAKNF